MLAWRAKGFEEIGRALAFLTCPWSKAMGMATFVLNRSCSTLRGMCRMNANEINRSMLPPRGMCRMNANEINRSIFPLRGMFHCVSAGRESPAPTLPCMNVNEINRSNFPLRGMFHGVSADRGSPALTLPLV